MSTKKKWNLLFIIDERSEFDETTKVLEELFENVDKAKNKEDALELFKNKEYDIVLSDLSVEPEKLGFLKQLKDIKNKQCLFAMVLAKDADKLYGIADLGINAFELEPSQFEAALEMISAFNPYEGKDA